MKNKVEKITLLLLLVITSAFSNSIKIGCKEGNISNIVTVNTLNDLATISIVNDGDMVFVKGFRTEYDGGGGIFIYDSDLNLEPFFSNGSVGYHQNYDGMIVKPFDNPGIGRWVRQWDRGKLNIRWFGGIPNATQTNNCSLAFNAALKYAQFNFTNSIFFNSNFTNMGKTIYFPTGRYYFENEILDITSGIVLEGEGSTGSTSQVGSTLFVNYEDDSDEGGFIRYIGNKSFNTGGGLRNLNIEVFNPNFKANVVTLFSKHLDNEGNKQNVSHWIANNIRISCKRYAKRALFARSYHTDKDEWYVRDINLINCYFGGATQEMSTVVISNVANFYMLGGFLYPRNKQGLSQLKAGIWITGNNGCINVNISGTTTDHIKLVKATDALFNSRGVIIAEGADLKNVKTVTSNHISAQ